MSSSKLVISWDEFHLHTRQLASQLKSIENITGIVAVTRGGIIPTGIITSELNIRLIDTVCVSSYDKNNQQAEINLLKYPNHDGDGWLFIEDLVDSGNTIRFLKQHFPKAIFACVYAKPNGVCQADYFVEKVEQDSWVQLPWEI